MSKTTDAPRKSRWSKGRVRAIAWITGGATFLTVMGVLGVSPKPAGSTEAARHRWKPRRQKVIVRHVIRRVVIVDPATSAPVSYVSGGSSYSGGSVSSSGGSSSGGSSGGGGGTTAPPPAPPPPPPPPPTSGS